MNKEGRVLTSDDDDYNLYRATSNITKKQNKKQKKEGRVLTSDDDKNKEGRVLTSDDDDNSHYRATNNVVKIPTFTALRAT